MSGDRADENKGGAEMNAYAEPRPPMDDVDHLTDAEVSKKYHDLRFAVASKVCNVNAYVTKAEADRLERLTEEMEWRGLEMRAPW